VVLFFTELNLFCCTERERAAAVRSAAEYCRLHCVHSIRVLFDIAITSGHLSVFEDEKKGLFPNLSNLFVEDKPIFGRNS
jgi:hypothetical protein